MYGRHTSSCEHRTRPAASGSHGSSSCSARCSAARRSDLADGRCRRRHARDHAVVGRPDPPARPAPTTAPAQPPSADRVRDYQDRLRALEAQAMRDAQPTVPAPGVEPVQYDDPQPPPPQDPSRPIESDANTRASLPATSCSADVLRPSGLTSAADTRKPASPRSEQPVRRSTKWRTRPFGRPRRAAGLTPAQRPSAGASSRSQPRRQAGTAGRASTPDQTPPISAAGPLHRVLEGTIIDTVLTNRSDGSNAAPVNCLVTNALYSHTGRQVLIPAGARILGETKPVQAFGETRLAVAFHRLLMPDGRTYRLDQFLGLNQIGDAGLRDKVNNHYLATFGAAAAVGLISGLSQYLGSAGLGSGDGEPNRRHRRRCRRCDVAGCDAGDESVSEQASDHHHPRRTPREGVPHQRSRTTGLRGAGGAN